VKPLRHQRFSQNSLDGFIRFIRIVEQNFRKKCEEPLRGRSSIDFVPALPVFGIILHNNVNTTSLKRRFGSPRVSSIDSTRTRHIKRKRKRGGGLRSGAENCQNVAERSFSSREVRGRLIGVLLLRATIPKLRASAFRLSYSHTVNLKLRALS